MRLLTLLAALFVLPLAARDPAKLPDIGIPQSITVRTTENVTKGGWVWLLVLGRSVAARLRTIWGG